MIKQEMDIPGPEGALEAVVHLPDDPSYERFAIVCHPHPLQEGNMQHKVVTTMVKAFNAEGIPCVRFNFRGVGKSAGTFGHIAGEVADCMSVVAWVQQQWPNARLYFAGFSFGAYVAAEAASKVANTQILITIAPSVERMPYYDLPNLSCPWLVVQGENDEIVDPQAVYAWFDQLQANKTMRKFSETGHFFHGKLIELQTILQSFVNSG